ncbi:methionine--tRNA ligase [Chelatococcus sp. GCM10030263]|uniref:methionine--tRNA ligase n=1 Tax=Chelatococcus sp. GCM10030263 TaxID=3273387 RepID=UPI00360E7F11
MVEKSKFYITTAISYPNGAPHIGHAYEDVATDAIARFKRLDGYEVFFLTGVDEHGLKMMQTAAREGLTPRALADRNSALFRQMAETFAASHDRFIRTTEPAHYAASQELWRRMRDAGDIYLGTYAGWYSVRDEAFYDESETRVENGQRLGPQGTPVEWTEEQTYFFRLSAYQERLLAHYEANPGFIAPETRRNEVVSFVKGGLQDLSISRTALTWGVPVPDAPDHVMYVWVDALTNYLTGVGFPDAEAATFERFWPADVHIIGKDITRFHAVYWPAFLMSAGLPLPKRVFGHGFLFNRGEKMSKSVGNVIDPFALADAYGLDQLRYFLLREVPFGQDGNYSHEAIVNRINADLANDLGNLAQRSLSMIAKNCDGTIPQPSAFTPADEALLAAADALLAKGRAAMEDFALHAMLAEIWSVVAEANRYFAAQAPWTLRKSDPARMATVLYVTAEVLRTVAILARPVTPTAADKLLDLLAVSAAARDFAALGPKGRLAAGAALPPPMPIFPRYMEPEEGAA